MNRSSIGFVGGGRVARILLGGWTRARRPISDVVISDTDASVLERLHAEFPSVSVTDDNRQPAKQAVVFLALHPPAFPAVLAEVKESLFAEATVVSLAPRWTISRICGLLGGFTRLARVIPNAPSIVNKGYNPVAFSEQLAPAGREQIISLLAPLGACPEVPEPTLEAYAIVSAMGPTYLWYQLYQLVDLACEFGMTREGALHAVTEMAAGAADTMTAAHLSPEAVMDLIPVKPLAAIEPTVKESYASVLGALHAKLKG